MLASPSLAMVACANFFLMALHPCLASLGVLNIDELNEMKYGIEILADPVVKGQSRPAETLFVSSKYGQQYECQLPPQAVFRSAGESSGGEHGSLYQGLAIPELLKPMANVPCLLKTRDWWTYEFCYGKDIKQYHMEGSEIKGGIMHLGFYDSEFDWSNETAKAGKRHRLKRYHSQLYRNGTQCDLNGHHREAEVRFVCEEGGSGDYLSRVDEPQSCMYVLTVHTVRLCAHPDMRIPTRANPQPIRCQPSLTPKEYEEYFRTRVSATQKKVDRMAQELRSLDHLLGQEEENAHEEKDTSTFSDSRGSPQQEVEEGATVPGGEADAGGADGDQHEVVEEEQTKGETNALKDGSSPHQEVEIVTLRSVQDALKRTFGEDVLEQPGDDDQQMQFKIIRNQGDLMKFLEEMQEKKKKKAAKGDRESKAAAPSSSSSDDKMDVSREGFTENSARDTGSDSVAENDISSTPSRDGKTEAKGSEEERGEEEEVEEEDEEEEEEDDDDVEVLREFVQELRGMNLHSSDIQNVKQHLQQNIEGEFDSILEEAEAELEAEGLKGEFDKEEATKSLAGTLNRLMEKLDGTGDSGPGQDSARERRHTGGTQHVGAATDTVSATPASTAANPAKKDGDKDLMDVGRVRVRVRRLRSGGSAQGGESATRAEGRSGDQVRKIENVVKEQLEKAGMRAEGKIDVKVVSSGALGGDDDDDGAWLSDEDTRSFRDMLLGFLTGDSDEMYREQQRQQQLEDNYRFMLGGDSAAGEDSGTQGQPVLADGDEADA